MNKNSVRSDPRDTQIERMMKQYGTPVLRMCCAYLRDPSLAEDAVQEAFIKAYRKLDRAIGFDQKREKAWLMKIAINTCKDYFRGSWFRHIDRNVAAEDLASQNYEMDWKDRLLSDAVIQLPRKLKEVVLLFYYQEMSYEEVAKALSISRSTVYNRLVSARARMKDLLERWDWDEP